MALGLKNAGGGGFPLGIMGQLLLHPGGIIEDIGHRVGGVGPQPQQVGMSRVAVY